LATAAETRRRLERLGQERALIYKRCADRTSQGRTGVNYRGQVVLDAAMPYLILNRPTKRTDRARRYPCGPILPPISGVAADKAIRFAGSRQSHAGRSIRLETPATRKPNQGNSTGERGILSVVVCRAKLPADMPLSPFPRAWSESSTATLAAGDCPR